MSCTCSSHASAQHLRTGPGPSMKSADLTYRLWRAVAAGARTCSYAAPARRGDNKAQGIQNKGRNALLHDGRKAEFTSVWSTRNGCPWQSSIPSCRVETAAASARFLPSISELPQWQPQPALRLLSVPHLHHRICPPASLGEKNVVS